jgi:ribosomal protein L32
MKKLTAQQQVLEDFKSSWEKRTGQQYFINWGKEVKFANTLIDMGLTPDEYTARKQAFFADDKWWTYGGWGFATFVNNINKLVTIQRTQTKPTNSHIQMIACSDCGTEHPSNKQCPNCGQTETPWTSRDHAIEEILRQR